MHVTDEELKRKLDEIIDGTAAILIDVVNQVSEGDALKQKVAALQVSACKLPRSLHQQASLSSLALKVANACLFILAFSLAVCLGAAFHSWFFSSLTLDMVIEILVNLVAYEVIPVGTLGLFAYHLSQKDDKAAYNAEGLQADIAQFGENALAKVLPTEDVLSLQQDIAPAI